MSIFNSLGSNYSSAFVWRSLFNVGSLDTKPKLKEVLGKYYGGQAELTYKGREALELALNWSGLEPGSKVGINGFTCYVVYRAVERAGYKPVMIDVAPKQMHFGLDQLKPVVEAEKLKAIIVQHTLGFSADMPELAEYCHKNKIMVIEDLAHSLGAKDTKDQEAGMVGDLTMLSFSQDKPLDVVAGGAVIDRRPGKRHKEVELKSVSSLLSERNRDYPYLVWIIRSTYRIGVGRGIHYTFKKLHLLANPMSDPGPGLHRMSTETARLVLSGWKGREDTVAHRREIAKVYQANLPKELQLSKADKGQPSYLRFPLWIDDRASLISYLRRFHIYIGDTWYDSPIAPGRYLGQTDYLSGLCPNSEELSRHIVNLPTHRGVSPAIAEDICAKIKQWQASQSKTKLTKQAGKNS